MSTTSYDRITEQWMESARAGQTAVADSVRTWSESVGALWSAPAGRNPWDTLWLGPRQAVDAAFDVAEEVLATQRALVHALLDSTRPLVEEAGESMRPENVTEPVVEATGAAADATREVAREQRRQRKEHYRSMTVEELQEEARKAGVEGRSQMNKQELVAALTG